MQKNMDERLINAIKNKQRLQFVYNNKLRIAEPQCYGIGMRGTELLRIHQIQGGGEREPLFDVSKITDLVVLNESFKSPGPNYKRGDSAMKQIFCQL
jgi:hypothetical protein